MKSEGLLVLSMFLHPVSSSLLRGRGVSSVTGTRGVCTVEGPGQALGAALSLTPRASL